MKIIKHGRIKQPIMVNIISTKEISLQFNSKAKKDIKPTKEMAMSRTKKNMYVGLSSFSAAFFHLICCIRNMKIKSENMVAIVKQNAIMIGNSIQSVSL